jgi:hypothetical protein
VQRAECKGQSVENVKLHALCPMLSILCALLFCCCSSAFADGPSAYLNMNYTNIKQFEDGIKTQTSDNFTQNYYFRLDKSVTPIISYQLNLRSTLIDSRVTDAEGDTTKTYLRAIEPALDVFLRNPAYNLTAGYRRLEEWPTARLSDDSRRTTDFYYSRFNITPYALPLFSLQFDRQRDYDHLSAGRIDTTDTRYSGSSWYDLLYKDIRLSYNLTYSREETETPLSTISKITNDTLNGLYNVLYNKSLMGGMLNVSTGYQGNYVRNKNVQFATQSGNVSLKRTPSLGLYGFGTQLQPAIDTLTQVTTLSDGIYNMPATTASGTTNIGQNGSKFHNIGIQLFSSTKPVETIYIYVNKDVTLDTNLTNINNWKVYHSDSNFPNTWKEIPLQSVTVDLFDILNNVYRYKIQFAASQNDLYFRALNMDVASVNDVLVTEIEAFGTDVIPKSGTITDISTFFTQGINLNANLRPTSKLTLSLNYFLNRADQDPESVLNSIRGVFGNIFSNSVNEKDNKLKSNITRTYGATAIWLTHRLLTTTVRFQKNEAFDNKNEVDLTANTYSLSLGSSPLPTIDSNLSFIRTYNYSFGRKQSINSLYLLTVGSKLYKDINMITDIGYTESENFATENQNAPATPTENTGSSTRYIRGTMNAYLTPKLSGNLTYGISRTSGSQFSSINDGALIVTYRPGRFISFSGTFKVSDEDNKTTTMEGLLIDWLFLPAIRMNLNYQHSNTKPEPETIDSASGYVIWYITRFLDFQFNYNYTRDVKEKKDETYTIGGNLICRFW